VDVKRTVGRLADGREILWFDRDEGVVRDTTDRRSLPPTATTSQIRYDAVLDEWVAIASHRQDRTFLPPADLCPLCPSREGRLTEVPSDDYDVVVFENRFPSFSTDIIGVETTTEAGGLFVTQPGYGRCEVVCFTSDHFASFEQLSHDQVRLVVEAWADRTADLSALEHVEQVYPFENRGIEIGVTLSHPHGQIYAYPFVTPRTRRMLDSARRYRERTLSNLFADLLSAERESGERVVAHSEHWTAFVPSAARWPVEVHLYPHRRVPDIPALTDAERDDFAELYLDVLHRLDGLYDERLPYIAAWQQAPVRTDRDLAYLHLQVFSIRRAPGKLKYLAGSESGMGVFINDVLPEQAAQRLRDVDLAAARSRDEGTGERG
jgi:UDPglucose--hexose-1-phosphate uridylyltransferase